MSGTDKITRILILFNRLIRGEYIDKTIFSIEHNITERSVERDIQDIRIFLSDIYTSNELIFDKEHNAYYLTGDKHIDVSSVEILALVKILLSSRAFRKDEMAGLISSMCSLVSSDKKKHISQLLFSELDSYTSPNHNKAILKIQWDLGQCILKQQIIELLYYKANGEQVKRTVAPISILFSEYYFYLVAFRDDQEYVYPAFFRLDRIESFDIIDRKYPRVLFEKYIVGDMKKCIQFMYTGELIKVKLRCHENTLESILDRLPNAKVIAKEEMHSIVTAKIFGDGFIRWVLSQGSAVEVLEPIGFREKLKKQVIDILNLYMRKDE